MENLSRKQINRKINFQMNFPPRCSAGKRRVGRTGGGSSRRDGCRRRLKLVRLPRMFYVNRGLRKQASRGDICRGDGGGRRRRRRRALCFLLICPINHISRRTRYRNASIGSRSVMDGRANGSSCSSPSSGSVPLTAAAPFHRRFFSPPVFFFSPFYSA